MRPLLPALLLLASLPAAHAQTPDPKADSHIDVDHAWARATAGQSTTGAAYLTMTELGAPDRLVGASTPVAATAQVHETFDDHGVMKMRPVQAFELQTGVPVTFSPGGMHLMLMGLKQPLHPGDHFPVTLTFEHAPPVTTEVTVGTVGETMPPMPGMGAMPGMGDMTKKP